MPGELIKSSEIMKFVHNGVIESDTAVEDLHVEREKWEAGGTAADQRVATAYAALEEGRQLVDIHTVIVRGGTSKGDAHLPALAIAPAFSNQVRVRAWHDGHVEYLVNTPFRRLLRPWRMDVATTQFWNRSDEIWRQAMATPPVMPPKIRDQAKKEHLVLWEATWQKTTTRVPRPPMHLDPALLEHVSGALYFVVDTWDLTELEAAALR